MLLSYKYAFFWLCAVLRTYTVASHVSQFLRQSAKEFISGACSRGEKKENRNRERRDVAHVDARFLLTETHAEKRRRAFLPKIGHHLDSKSSRVNRFSRVNNMNTLASHVTPSRAGTR